MAARPGNSGRSSARQHASVATYQQRGSCSPAAGHNQPYTEAAFPALPGTVSTGKQETRQPHPQQWQQQAQQQPRAAARAHALPAAQQGQQQARAGRGASPWSAAPSTEPPNTPAASTSQAPPPHTATKPGRAPQARASALQQQPGMPRRTALAERHPWASPEIVQVRVQLTRACCAKSLAVQARVSSNAR